MAGEEKKPLTLSVYFEELRSNIQPPENRLAVATEIPRDVRKYLEENGPLRRPIPTAG